VAVTEQPRRIFPGFRPELGACGARYGGWGGLSPMKMGVVVPNVYSALSYGATFVGDVWDWAST
jgi:hypothetical protein